jgi:hypothetical protein
VQRGFLGFADLARLAHLQGHRAAEPVHREVERHGQQREEDQPAGSTHEKADRQHEAGENGNEGEGLEGVAHPLRCGVHAFS